MGEDPLQELGETVDNPKSQVLAELDLHHLSRKFLAHLANFLSSELYLPSALLDQVIDKQGCEELCVIITGMAA
jgi:hypothetical protein